MMSRFLVCPQIRNRSSIEVRGENEENIRKKYVYL